MKPKLCIALLAVMLAACIKSPSLPSVTANPAPSPNLASQNAPPVTPTQLPAGTSPASRLTATSSNTPSPAPSATHTRTSPPSASPTPTPTVCLTRPAPITSSTRQAPLAITFNSDGNIWLWRESAGQATQITHTGDAQAFSWSPDRRVIAFIRNSDNQNELWAANGDGGGQRRLVSTAEVEAKGGSHDSETHNVIGLYSWITGTHQLVYSVFWSVDRIGGCCTTVGYWRIDADSLASRRWPAPRSIGGLLSPDGKRLAIVGASSLSLANADGSNRRDKVLTYPNGPYEGDAWAYSLPLVWSPDSKFLLAVVPSPEPFAPDTTLNTWRIPADGSHPTHFASFPGAPANDQLSPNQEYIAFWRPVEPLSNVRELHIAKFDGSANVIYAVGYLMEFLGWSPDSVHFAFGEFGEPQLGNICGASEPLTDIALANQVRWIDSTRFLFVSGREQDPHGLWLGEIGKKSIRVGDFNGNQATYTVNSEDSR
jgi:hypothetical protein